MLTTTISAKPIEELGDGFVRFPCQVTLPDGVRLFPYCDIESQYAAEEVNLGGFALALCLLAASKGERLYIDGPLPADLAGNIEEVSTIWHLWLPEHYRPLKVNCTELLPPIPAANTQHIFAFSGGVDATCAVLRHRHRLVGARTREIGAAVLVQGFDLPLGRTDIYEQAKASADHVLSSLGIPLLILRTNLKDLGVNWEHSFLLQLVGALSLFSGRYRGTVSGSGCTYRDFPMPWGSNPILDPWLSTTSFNHYTDSHDLRRIEKIALIVKYPDILPFLRVCYSNANSARNCGRCEKCLRTMLSLDALGCLRPDMFDGQLSRQAISSIRVQNRTQWLLLEETLAYCRDSNIRPNWYGDLARVLKRGYGPRFEDRIHSAWINARVKFGIRTRLRSLFRP